MNALDIQYKYRWAKWLDFIFLLFLLICLILTWYDILINFVILDMSYEKLE